MKNSTLGTDRKNTTTKHEIKKPTANTRAPQQDAIDAPPPTRLGRAVDGELDAVGRGAVDLELLAVQVPTRPLGGRAPPLPPPRERHTPGRLGLHGRGLVGGGGARPGGGAWLSRKKQGRGRGGVRLVAEVHRCGALSGHGAERPPRGPSAGGRGTRTHEAGRWDASSRPSTARCTTPHN